MAIEIERQAPFSCFPVCIRCTNAGKCERTIVERTGPAKAVSSRPRSRKAIEKLEDSRLAVSWLMKCGHYTDADVQLLYRVWKPRGKDEYCEYCGKWQKKAPAVRPQDRIPDEPLY